jgi:hypothetical protein
MRASARRRAKRDGLPFNLSNKDIYKLLQGGVCPVLGLPFNFHSHKMTDASATLDKFVPALGYVRGNCFVISALANRLKGSATPEQLFRVAYWVEKQMDANPMLATMA